MKTFIAILLVSTTCHAGLLEYSCTVRTELSLNDDGLLKPYPLPQAVGSTFIVDRQRGTILGKPMRNTTAAEVRVLSRGSKESAFKVISIASDGAGKATTDLLTIHEFVSPRQKPFVALTSLGEVYSGTCL